MGKKKKPNEENNFRTDNSQKRTLNKRGRRCSTTRMLTEYDSAVKTKPQRGRMPDAFVKGITGSTQTHPHPSPKTHDTVSPAQARANPTDGWKRHLQLTCRKAGQRSGPLPRGRAEGKGAPDTAFFCSLSSVRRTGRLPCGSVN